MKKYILVLALLFGGCWGCAPKQTIHIGGYEAQIISMPLDTTLHMMALTKCDKDGHPVIVVSTTADESQLYYTIEHEKAHVKQMERLGLDCQSFSDRYTNDPSFRFEMESEAYCVGFMTTIYMRDYNYMLSYPNFVKFVNSVFPNMTYNQVYMGLPCRPSS